MSSSMVLRIIARSAQSSSSWVEIGDDLMACLLDKDPGDACECGLFPQDEIDNRGMLPLVYKLDDPITFAIRGTYLAECLEQLSEAMRNGGESASRLQEMAILGRELNDFCIGLKWAAKCTQIKEKKNDQK